VIRTLSPAHAGLPQSWTENHHRQEEENPCHFKPDNSADTPEGAQKSANPARDSSGRLPRNLAHSTALRSARFRIAGLNSRDRLACGSLGAGS
jgi:hypothetical protein